MDSTTPDIDVVSHYHDLLTSNPDLTPPIAAISSLLAVLSATPLTTIQETLLLLSSTSSTLVQSQQNPIPVSAGTELLQRYIVTSFQAQLRRSSPSASRVPSRPGSRAGEGNSDFAGLRRHVLTQSKLFVTRTKGARGKIAGHALPLLRDGTCIVTYGASRCVAAVLQQVAAANRDISVVFVDGASSTPDHGVLDKLSAAQIPVCRRQLSQLSHTLVSLPSTVSQVVFLLGADAVLENGSILAQMGTRLICTLAQANRTPVYFAAESYKFVRRFPLRYGAEELAKMGCKQDSGDVFAATSESKQIPHLEEGKSTGANVELTPPELVAGGIITENGIMSTEGVAEELIKLWF